MKAWEYLSGWTNFGLPTNVQKRLYKFLLQKAIGQFIQNDLDNFDIDLKNGFVELRKLELNLEKLNDILNDVPLLLERGQVESIQISLPWSNLSGGDVYLKIQGLNIDLVPANKTKTDVNIEESIILSSSLHFADNFLKTQVEVEEEDDDLRQSIDDLQSQPTEGLEVLTRVIDKMLSKFKIDIFDTNIRIIHDESAVLFSSCEYEQNNSNNNIKYAIELCIPQISLFDETPEFDNVHGQTDKRQMAESSMLLPPISKETIKIITINSPTLWLTSLHRPNDTSSLAIQNETFLDVNYSLEDTQFYEAEQGNSMILDDSRNNDGGTSTPKANDHHQPYRSLLFTTVDKDNWIRIKQQNNSSPIKQLDFLVTHARVTITPKQLTFVVDLLESMTRQEQQQQQIPVSPQPSPYVSPQTDSRTSKSNHNRVTYLDSPQPQIKIKMQLSLVEFYLLSQEAILDKEKDDFNIKGNHVRLSINQFIVRLQQYSKTGAVENPCNSTIDIRISDIALDEWILKPPEASNFAFYGTCNQKLFQTKYNAYSPIIAFDNSIKYNYSKEEIFPVYSNERMTACDEKNQAIRIRIEKRQSKIRDRYRDGLSYDEDIAIDIQAFKVNIDPQIIDRLENHIYAFKDLLKQKVKDKGRSEHLSEQAVYEDLGRQANQLEENKRIRLKMAFIRITLFVPDMSHVCTRNEFNDRYHSDQLSLDIVSLDGSWNNNSFSTETPLSSKYYAATSLKPNPTRLSISLDYVNVFLKLHDEDVTKCWFTGSSIPISSKDIQKPTIEVILHNDPYTADANSNILKAFFDYLDNKERNRNEAHVNIPTEVQIQSILNFKRHALQTSTIEINCHFPKSQVRLTKKIWDKIQILQNDIVLWQPRFFQQLSSSFEQSYDSGSSNRYSNTESTSFSSEKSMVYTNNLISVSAMLSESTWYLYCTDVNCYRIDFNEFQYFALIKHLGQNENVTMLDINDLCLYDISSNEKIIIYRAIPDEIKASIKLDKLHDKDKMPMVSLISRLSLLPESNFQRKYSSITLNQLCWKASNRIETDFINHIVDFQKLPEEIVFIDPVTQHARVYVHLLDSYIDYMPDSSPSYAAFILDGLEIFTSIIPSQPAIDILLFLESTDFLLIDDRVELSSLTSNSKYKFTSSVNSKNYLTAMGFLSALKIENIHLDLKIKLEDHTLGPKLDVLLSKMDIYLDTCLDSFQTLINLVTYIANETKSNLDHPEQHQIPSYIVQSSHDMFASVDENTFKKSMLRTIAINQEETPQFSYVEEYFTTKGKNDDNNPINILPPEKPLRRHRIRKNDDIVRVLSEETDQFQIVDNFYKADGDGGDKNEEVENLLESLYNIKTKNINFKWNLYDGYDWDYLRADMASIKHTKKKQERLNEHGQTGFGDELIDPFSSSSLQNTNKFRRRTRRRDSSIEIILKSLSIDLNLMSEATSMKLGLHIKDVEILDHIKTSKWNKFLGYMRSSKIPRETNSKMVNIQLIGLRPVPDRPNDQEYRLEVELLPIRLFIDQDALYFLIKYFTFDSSNLRSTIATNSTLPNPSSYQNTRRKKESSMFFQFVHIHPTMLKIDYKAKHIDYSKVKGGRFSELVNLINLEGAQVKLNRIKLSGLTGWDGLLDKLGEEWISHIKATQIGNMVSGIAPIRPVVNLSKGASDIVRLPIQQYKKDGRIINGLSKGTQSFARATAIEMIKLSSKVTSGTQVVLEHADGLFSSNSNSQRHSNESSLLSSSPSSSYYYNQSEPHFTYTDINGMDIVNDDDAYEKEEDYFKNSGSSSGGTSDIKYSSIELNKEYITTTSFDYQDLGSVAQETYILPIERSGNSINTSSSSSASTRATAKGSSSVIRPLINLTNAFQTILTGLRNSIDPVTRLQNEDKYKRY